MGVAAQAIPGLNSRRSDASGAYPLAALRPPQAKQERLRQAKAEAEREIAAYKAEREGAYQKKLAEVGRASAHASAPGCRTASRPAQGDGPRLLRRALDAVAGWRQACAAARVCSPLQRRGARLSCPPPVSDWRASLGPPPRPSLSLPQTTSGAAATSERLHKETELAIKQVQADVTASKKAVVDMLVKYATTVTA